MVCVTYVVNMTAEYIIAMFLQLSGNVFVAILVSVCLGRRGGGVLMLCSVHYIGEHVRDT